MPALEELECYQNQLTTLDLSNNKALKRLQCQNNKLTTLDVSENTALTTLWCSNNQLTSLDISKNTELTSLNCRDNVFTITPNPDRTFDLSTLPDGFDIERVKYFTDADKVEGNILTVKANISSVKYMYDVGNDKQAQFTLYFTPHKHSYNGWQYNETNHWKVCESCGYEKSKGMHIAKTINAKSATTTEPGYTGDKVCKTCNYLIEKGEEIPILHVHSYGDWQYDAETHWKECGCGDKVIEEHAVEVVGAKEETLFKAGYTGDKVCTVCGCVVEKGEEIPAKIDLSEIIEMIKELLDEVDPEVIEDIVKQIKDIIENIDPSVLGDLLEQIKDILDNLDPETNENVRDALEEIIDFIKDLIASGGDEPTTSKPEEDNTDNDADTNGSIDTDANDSTDTNTNGSANSGTNGSTGEGSNSSDTDADANANGSDVKVPDTGATASITAFAMLSVAAAAAFVSRRRKYNSV